MSLEQDLHDAARLAHDAALVPQWVQASGGNASVKDPAEDRLVIKASGMRFSEVTPHHGLSAIKLSAVHALLDDASYDSLSFVDQQERMARELVAAQIDAAHMRPSLETGFHSLGARFCLHTHPICFYAGLSLEGGRELLLPALEGLGGGAVWVPLRPPGYSLARVVRQALKERPGASLVLMEQHGLAVYGRSLEETLDLTRDAVQRVTALFGEQAPPTLQPDKVLLDKVRDRLRHLLTQDLGASHAHTALAEGPYAASYAAGGDWAWSPVCADAIIFCGMDVPLLSPEQALDHRELMARFAHAPHRVALAVQGQGVVLAAPQERALHYMQEMLHANALACAMGRTRGRMRRLDPDTCRLVAGMEGERYRQKLTG